MSAVIWSDQASQLAEDKEVNFYLVRSRLHGNLLGKDKLTVIWSDPRLRRKFLEIELLSGRMQASQ